MYIFEIGSLSVTSFVMIFSHSEGCLFTLHIVSFVVQKLLIFILSVQDLPCGMQALHCSEMTSLAAAHRL